MGPHGGLAANRLALSLSGRYDSYSDAATLSIEGGLQLAAIVTYRVARKLGKIVPRTAILLDQSDQVGVRLLKMSLILNLRRALTVFVLGGPIPDMKPETARPWTAWCGLTPRPSRTFPVAEPYFDIGLRGGIHNWIQCDLPQQEAQFASLITRNPTQAQSMPFAETRLWR